METMFRKFAIMDRIEREVERRQAVENRALFMGRLHFFARTTAIVDGRLIWWGEPTPRWYSFSG